MEMTSLVQMLRRGVWILVLGTILGLGAGKTYAAMSTPVYTASTDLYLAVQTGGTTAAELSQGSDAAETKVESYLSVVKSEIVLDKVLRKEGLGMTASQLAAHVTATNSASSVLQIAVSSTEPRQAMRLANAVAEEFGTTVKGLEPTLADGTSPVKITSLRSAKVPLTPVEPRTSYDLALGGIVGLVLALGVVLGRGLLDTRLRSANEVEGLDVAVLGGMGFNPDASTDPLVVAGDTRSPLAEAFRDLRTNIAYSSSGTATPVILMTSALPSEGKTTTVANLALVTAQADARVLLIDADLRRPRIAELMGIEGAAGLSDVLVGRAEPDDVIQAVGSVPLDVLPAGRIPPNPSELLGSDTMRHLITVFADTYDVVLIDAPPTLPVTDAAVLSKLATGVVVAAASKQTRLPSLASALERLRSIDAKVLGVVITKIRSRNQRDFGYGAGYGAGYGYGSYEPVTGAPEADPGTTGGRRARTAGPRSRD